MVGGLVFQWLRSREIITINVEMGQFELISLTE